MDRSPVQSRPEAPTLNSHLPPEANFVSRVLLVRMRPGLKVTAAGCAVVLQSFAPQNASAAIDGTFTGAVSNTQFGPVQVQIDIVAGKIIAARALQLPSATQKDIELNKLAVPYLIQETIKANGADIQGVGGASYTSQGWYESLVSALAQAGQAPAPQAPAPQAPAAPLPTGSDSAITDTIEPDVTVADSVEVNVFQNKYSVVSISSNFPMSKLSVVATKKGVRKKLTYKFTTKADGSATFKTSSNLTGYTLILFHGATEIDRTIG